MTGAVGRYAPDRVESARRARWGEPAYPNRIDKSGGPDACWPWTGVRHTAGYGVVVIDGVRTLAHRLALQESLGRPLGAGMEACHTCDNPPCCNPAHLFEGTHRDNMRDAAAKGRNGSQRHPDRHPRGEHVNTARLTVDQVRDIRACYRPGEGSPTNSVRLAQKYGVGKTAILNIVAGRTWSHVLLFTIVPGPQ